MSFIQYSEDVNNKSQPQSDKEIQKLAVDKSNEILKDGDAFEYIYKVWQKRHIGDAPLGKSLLFSLGSQSVSNSKGIHVLASGEGGFGKSDGVTQMGKLVHPVYWINGDVTPQSLYYCGSSMPDGVVVGLEDVVWKSELGATVKRITSDFQVGASKTTTVEMRGEKVQTAK